MLQVKNFLVWKQPKSHELQKVKMLEFLLRSGILIERFERLLFHDLFCQSFKLRELGELDKLRVLVPRKAIEMKSGHIFDL